MNNKKIQSYDIVIFGAKGDLASKKLIPSLYSLEEQKLLHQDTRIIGVGRANWNRLNYINNMYESLIKIISKNINIKTWSRFKNRISFCNLDVTQIARFFVLKKILFQTLNTKIYYLSMPPKTFSDICIGLGISKLNYYPNKIVMEKPIGISLESSRNIHTYIEKYFNENQIMRIDHYLGKETILNLLILRFANPLFYYIWNKDIIDNIKIIVHEKIGIENRWEYFNKIGQTRDMVQNHLLQILSLIAMSPPKKLNAKYIKQEKIKLLKSLIPITKNNIHQTTIMGQYSSGKINNQLVSAYVNEMGMTQKSNTETFVAIKVNINNKRWLGVPFYLETGKRLKNKKSEIIISFKKIPINLFNKKVKNNNNKLIIKLQPKEGMKIKFLNKNLDINSKYITKKNYLKFNYNKGFKNLKIYDAYERIFLEIMKNDFSLFVSKDEVEISWKWIDSIIQSWKDSNNIPVLYPSGSNGPQYYF